VLPRVTAGLAKAGRPRARFEISGGGFLATGPDDATVAERFEWVRQRVAFYGSTPSYWPVLAAHGLEDLGQALNQLTRQGRWGDMAALVKDDVVHLFAAVGRHDQLAAAIAARFGGLSDTIQASANPEAPADLPPDLVQDLKRLPSAFEGFSAPGP